MIYFISDIHFGHKNIIKHCNRPFLPIVSSNGNVISAVEVMDQVISQNWNDNIKKNDTVYFLGDLSFYSVEKTIDIVNRLNGKKYWISGNHDSKLIKHKELTSLFEWVKPIETIHIQDPDAKGGRNKIILCHYPLMSWDSSYHGSWHLHGHSHGLCEHPNKNAVDVGVDCFNYSPVSYETIKAKLTSND